MEERGKLKEVNHCRVIAGLISFTGMLAIIVGYLSTTITSIEPIWGTYPEYTALKNAGLPLIGTPTHPHTTEGIVIWIIGDFLWVIGIAGIYYFTCYARKHEKALDI